MMNKNFFLIALVVTFLTLPAAVGAQTSGPSPTVSGPSPTVSGPTPTVSGPSSNSNCGNQSGALTNPLNACDLTSLIQEVITNVLIPLGTVFLTVMIMYVGFQFVSARGNEEKITNARTALLWTVVGGLLLLGASVIAQGINATVSSL